MRSDAEDPACEGGIAPSRRASTERGSKISANGSGAGRHVDVAGTLHQGILWLFEDDPWLAFDLVRPTMTALCAAVHGCNGDLEGVRVAIAVFNELPERLRRRYKLTVVSALTKAEFELIRGELHDVDDRDIDELNELYEIEMESGLVQYFHQKTHEKALAEGRAEGRKSTLIEMIFALLDARGIPSDDGSTARIRECDDLSVLERWARRAREVGVVSELFSPT